jgi:PAS domain S-box-containing protein
MEADKSTALVETNGSMIDLLRSFDWSKTVLGDRGSWSATLNAAINICLHSKLPTLIVMGGQLIPIYNDAYKKVIGQKHPRAFGTPLRDTWPEADTEPMLRSVLKEGKSFLVENHPFTLNRNGYPEECFFSFSYSPIYNEADQVEGVFVTLTETTDIVQKEEQLRKLRNKQLENLFIQAPVAMCILKGSDLIVEVANAKMLELWGKSETQMVNKPLFVGLSDARNQGFEGILNNVYTKGERAVFDEILVKLERKGKTEDVFVKFVYEPIRERDNTITGIMVVADEITEQVKSKRRVEESEERLRLAIQSTGLGTWDFNPVTGELNWSEECRKIYAFPVGAQLDFQVFSDHIFPADKEFVQREIAKSQTPDSEGRYDITYRILRFDDKSIRWIRAKGQVFFDVHSQPDRFIGTVIDITEQKNLEEELRSSEQRVRLAIEAASMGTFDWDIPNSIFYYSDRLANIFGYTNTTGLNQESFGERIHPQDKDMRLAAHETAFKNGTLFYEARVIWPDATIHWVSVTGKVVYDEYGKPSRMHGTTVDITEEKAYSENLEREVLERTEHLRKQNVALKKSEERYHKMIDEVQDYAIILLNSEGIIQNWNKGAEKIKLYTESEIVGKHFSIFYLPEDQQSNLPQRLINQARNTGKASQEGWRKRKDGSRFWGSITITALHGPNHEVIGFSKVTRDLTDKKLAEDQLKKFTEELKNRNEQLILSEERYHQMIAEVQDYAIILLNVNGEIENWNTGAEFIKGYKAEEVIGKSFKIFYTKEDRDSKLPEKLLNLASTTGKAMQEGWRVRKNGSRFWGSIVITALHNKRGELIGYSKVTRDLSDKKAAEEKMLEYTRELELQNSELEQFAYVASHDLQEPLRKIQTFSEIIQTNINDESIVKKYFDKLNNSAQRMSELIKSVLNYSRLSRDETLMTDVDLNQVIIHVRSDFELLIEEKHALMNSEMLPIVKGNALQLGQLFSNLISNSLKFSNKNPVISIGASIVEKNKIVNHPEFLADRKYVEITVNDNGIGFDQQYENLIFTMFQRLHGKQNYAGTGIGLALCKKIVENHNGYIAAKSETGKGATFYVYFPL